MSIHTERIAGGLVSDTGEECSDSLATTDEDVSTPVMSAVLYERFTSRGNAYYVNKLLSAMRKQFDGHDKRRIGAK